MVNVYLVGVRGLRSIPAVEKIARLDERRSYGIAEGARGNNNNYTIGSIDGGADLISFMESNTSTSMGTRATFHIALNLAAKSVLSNRLHKSSFLMGRKKGLLKCVN